MELGFTEVKRVFNFMDGLKKKGYSPLLVSSDDKLVLELQFEYDLYKAVYDYIMDWMILNSSIVRSYHFEIFGDGYSFFCTLKELRA